MRTPRRNTMVQRLHSQWAAQSLLQAADQSASEVRRPGDSWRAALDAIPPDAPQEPLQVPVASLLATLPPSGDGTRIQAVRAMPRWVIPLVGGLLAICGTLVVLL